MPGRFRRSVQDLQRLTDREGAGCDPDRSERERDEPRNDVDALLVATVCVRR